MLCLRFCSRAFSSCGKRGPLFIAVRRPLTIAASLVAEHRLQTRRLSSCGSRAQLLHGMWDLPRPGLEPMSPALAGRFSTTAPPGKPPVARYWRACMPRYMRWGSCPIGAINTYNDKRVHKIITKSSKYYRSGVVDGSKAINQHMWIRADRRWDRKDSRAEYEGIIPGGLLTYLKK